MNKLLQTIKENDEMFIEKGADLEHDRWAGWHDYFLSKCIMIGKNGNNGNYVLELLPNDYERWYRLTQTKYKDLLEKEKESDRKEVIKYLPLIYEIKIKELEALVEVAEKQRKRIYKLEEDYRNPKYQGEREYEIHKRGYNQALDDIIQELKTIIKELKK